MKKLSDSTFSLSGQPMFALLVKAKELERQGRTIHHFEIGDSDYPAHKFIIEATKNALDEDKTHYVNSTGIPELKEAIQDYTHKTLGFRPDIEQIIVMPANAIIDFVMRCVVNPLEQVLIPNPGFPTYQAVANYTGIKAIPYKLDLINNCEPSMIGIRHSIKDKTRLLIINSPHNPTGSMLEKSDIETIYDITSARDLYVLSDEVYSRVVYDDNKHYSIGCYDKCKFRNIILNGFSKSYGMPGWRLGYAIGPKELINKMGILFQTIFSCTPPFIQYAGIAALTENQDLIDARIKKYQGLRDLIVERLNEIPGVSCKKPKGSYYVFPNIKDTGMADRQFADFALEKAGVALLPGSCFGEFSNDYVRLCYTKLPEVIDKGIMALKNALEDR